MIDDLRQGPLRMVCLLCGEEIQPYPQLVNGAAVPALAYREGLPAGTGYVHPACAEGLQPLALDLTGRPDYSDYDEDGANPAYPDGFDAVERGRAIDAALLQQKTTSSTVSS